LKMLNGFNNNIKCEELCKKCDFLWLYFFFFCDIMLLYRIVGGIVWVLMITM
jgi:hypothetical protein